MDLNERRIMVTGGARRVGAVLVRALAEAGARVVVHCRASRDEAAALVRSLPGSGHAVTVCDLADPAARAAWLAALPPLDGAVNNASAYRLPAVPESAEIYRQVNLEAPLAVIGHLYRHGGVVAVNMIDADILTASGGVKPADGTDGDGYGETRRALGMATLRLARELAPQFRLNAIAPGPTLPPVACAGPGMQKILDRVPLGRAVLAQDLAALLLLLLRAESLTGAIVPVDGGMHLGK